MAETSASQPSSTPIRQYRAAYDYTANSPTEATFKKNDIITVIETQGRWWPINTPSGLRYVPSNYLVELQSPHVPQPQPHTLLPNQGPLPSQVQPTLPNVPQVSPAQQATYIPAQVPFSGPFVATYNSNQPIIPFSPQSLPSIVPRPAPPSNTIQGPPLKKPKLTYLAQKYTHPTGSIHKVLVTDEWLKSGLTPLKPGPFNTPEEQAAHDAIELYQRNRFFGFTPSELHDFENLAFLDNNATESFLDTIPIHPLFQRKRWLVEPQKHIAKWPIRKNGNGYWEPGNNLVWNAMKPALQLASLFIRNSELWGFWDALQYGAYEAVPRNEFSAYFPVGPQFYGRFWRRPPYVFRQEDEVRKMKDVMLWVADHLQFFLFGGCTDHTNGMPAPGFTYGYMVGPGNSRRHKASIYVGHELIQPLLRRSPEYSDAERMVDHFRLATTILHETTHAINACLEARTGSVVIGEPYFEDECIQELGFSIENCLFGGLPTEVIPPRMSGSEHGFPAGGIFRINWNRCTHSEYQPQYPVLLNEPAEWLQQDYTPIPVHYFKTLHNPDFWNYFTKANGPESTYMGPRMIAVRQFFDEGTMVSTRPNVRITPIDLLDEDILLVDLSDDASSISTANLENDRRRLTTRIRLAIEKNILAGALPMTIPFESPMNPSPEPSESPSPDLPKPPEKIDRSQCPRYNGIRDFLCSRIIRRDLALDTLNFVIPEHTLLGYIVKRGGLQPELQADEWRRFLSIAHHKEELFSYDTRYCGLVTRIQRGWPTRNPSPRRAPHGNPISEAVMNCFYKCAAVVEDSNKYFTGGFLDQDMNDYLFTLNQAYQWNPDVRVAPEMPASGFDRQLFEQVLWKCWFKGEGFTYGPPGVIRKLLPGFVPMNIRRKRDVLKDSVKDTCIPS